MSNTENLAVLKRQRAMIKGSCTRIKHYVETITAINTSTTAQLEERKLKLEHYWAEYHTVQTQIEILEEAEGNDRAAFEDAFMPRCEQRNNSLEISDANYNAAWNLLKERYDNKRVIVQNHIKAIIELPSMTRENYTELRQIADGATKHIHALQALKRPTAYWDDILIHVLCSKFDPLTLREWQSSLTGNELPTSKQFFDFITRQCQMLEVTNKSSNVANVKDGTAKAHAKSQTACAATVKLKCNYCRGEHSIYYCKNFLVLQVPQRIAEIRSRKICLNCLRSNTHIASKCTSGGCKVCQAKHNTLLHMTTASQQAPNSSSSSGKGSDNSNSAESSAVVATHVAGGSVNVILSMAMVHARDYQGVLRPCRILLDCGSQANFISRKFMTRLGLTPKSLSVAISGVNGTVTTATQAVKIELQSRIDSYSATIDCIVSDQVTEKLPGIPLRRRDFELPRNIKLADPQFHVSFDIDILIGAEIFWDLLFVGQIQSSDRHPKLQKTRFGWILAGRMFDSKSIHAKVHSLHASITNEQLHDQLSRFWQLDDAKNDSNNLTPEESYCEQHFISNIHQNPQGRYVVKLPIRDQLIDKLGDSRSIAMSRLKGIEKRFKRQPDLEEQYKQIINEYISLGHMQKIELQPDESSPCFYLPHHCVFKSNNQTSKIRVVFDASCKSTEGLSLNDALMIGPVVQQELTSILIRFCFFIYVFSADLRMEHHQLSYLASRCLTYHADQYAAKYPVGSREVKRSFYVDDFLSGADTLHEAKVLRDELIELLRIGSFELSKWASNCPELLKNIKDRDGEVITIHNETDSSILGIQWNQVKDVFHFAYNSDSTNSAVSKRVILSEVSRLFDPLGLLGPVIVIAKLILQDLWKAGIHWDESVPQELHTSWLKFKSQLHAVNQLQIPRGVKYNPDSQLVQLHGFCDASQNAYGACIYVRTTIESSEYRSQLLCSKSRVAPLKAVSLPRLELSAAVLLAQLITKVKDSLGSPMQAFLWSDSTIALNWIASSSRNWSVFVANRVGEIQRLTQISQWRHVSSSDNPADILSRGIYPYDLIASSMWWHGPSFLQLHENQWPSGSFTYPREDMPEQRRIAAIVVKHDQCMVIQLLTKHSSLNKILRIIAYCMRFSKKRNLAPNRTISSSELLLATEIVCRAVQKQVFSKEYEALKLGTTINAGSRLLPLTPFMDKDDLIRVGGRLKNSNLDFDACHPILLPRNHDLTQKIIRQEHIRNMHAGTQGTMAAVRQRFWPLSLRSVARKIIQECVTCFKAKPRFSEALMGSLPAGRVTPSRPFAHCGIDYAGPVTIREGNRRNSRNHKAYIAIFVCFATKAAHIEVVSNLTTDCFLGAFKRFIARRGKPTHMYSDNGTTFVGAKKQIKELYEFYNKQETQSDLNQFCANEGICWEFIPPNAPHFGGLWEAAVKSAKHHLTRIVGQAHLNFEELQTVLSEIEAILNSRPITPLSEDPNDLYYLSPGHFLAPTMATRGATSTALLAQMGSSEYLGSLQERSKWKQNSGIQLRVNQLVLVKQQNLPPLQWAIGRVLEIHPGSDNVVRTATIKTTKGTYVRPLSKLAILPSEIQPTDN
ncbi:uncharacterized protein LOC114933775 [Nylanderia fulva]|uniref:uncharacterized protein LOC114933775 n=1 Tax=Nylanderia fulva TaxID=613905 RepID=UPI0010FAE592|nr:uncharacterized protein LOC114933775 [Nylanderia fulva]